MAPQKGANCNAAPLSCPFASSTRNNTTETATKNISKRLIQKPGFIFHLPRLTGLRPHRGRWTVVRTHDRYRQGRWQAPVVTCASSADGSLPCGELAAQATATQSPAAARSEERRVGNVSGTRGA